MQLPTVIFNGLLGKKKGYLRGEKRGSDRIMGRKLKGQEGIPIMPQFKKHIEKMVRDPKNVSGPTAEMVDWSSRPEVLAIGGQGWEREGTGERGGSLAWM